MSLGRIWCLVPLNPSWHPMLAYTGFSVHTMGRREKSWSRKWLECLLQCWRVSLLCASFFVPLVPADYVGPHLGYSSHGPFSWVLGARLTRTFGSFGSTWSPVCGLFLSPLLTTGSSWTCSQLLTTPTCCQLPRADRGLQWTSTFLQNVGRTRPNCLK